MTCSCAFPSTSNTNISLGGMHVNCGGSGWIVPQNATGMMQSIVTINIDCSLIDWVADKLVPFTFHVICVVHIADPLIAYFTIY